MFIILNIYIYIFFCKSSEQGRCSRGGTRGNRANVARSFCATLLGQANAADYLARNSLQRAFFLSQRLKTQLPLKVGNVQHPPSARAQSSQADSVLRAHC